MAQNTAVGVARRLQNEAVYSVAMAMFNDRHPTLNSQKMPHSSTVRWSYGMFAVSGLETVIKGYATLKSQISGLIQRGCFTKIIHAGNLIVVVRQS